MTPVSVLIMYHSLAYLILVRILTDVSLKPFFQWLKQQWRTNWSSSCLRTFALVSIKMTDSSEPQYPGKEPQQPEIEAQQSRKVCNFFRKPTKGKYKRKMTISEDEDSRNGTSLLQNKKKALKLDNKLCFSTRSFESHWIKYSIRQSDISIWVLEVNSSSKW